MPTTGGWAPNPERYGAGEGNSNAPLLQRVFESIASQRGSAYDQTTATLVGIENMAYARAITFDGWGVNQRLVNSYFPATMSAKSGMLQRWERIFGLHVLPTDTELSRRARVAIAWAQIGQPNTLQPILDALFIALGPVLVGATHSTYQGSVNYINGVSQTTVTGANASLEPTVTISGTPAGPYQFVLPIQTGGPRGTSTFKWSVNGGLTFVATGVATAASVTLGTTGMVAKFSTGTYYNTDSFLAFTAPGIPWLSSLATIQIVVTQAPNGYHNADGSPNQYFYAAVNSINTLLDSVLPAWVAWDWYINNSSGHLGFKFDEPNLDLEAFA